MSIKISKSQYERLLLEASIAAMQGLLSAESKDYNYGDYEWYNSVPERYETVADVATEHAKALLEYQGYESVGD
jgi:hypothetical protein